MTENVVWQSHKIGKAERSRSSGPKPCVLWFTGLSGSGKSTIADTLEVRLNEMGFLSYLLDGDNVRHGLNRDLGFSDADRVENIRRIAEVSKLFVDAGLIVLTAFISPFRADRDAARSIMGPGEFVEIYLDVPLSVCEARDPKGLYRKARAGEISNSRVSTRRTSLLRRRRSASTRASRLRRSVWKRSFATCWRRAT